MIAKFIIYAILPGTSNKKYVAIQDDDRPYFVKTEEQAEEFDYISEEEGMKKIRELKIHFYEYESYWWFMQGVEGKNSKEMEEEWANC